MTLNKKRGYGCTRLLLCLILVMIMASGWSGTTEGREELQVLNSSGNLNRKLSVDPIRKSEGYSTVLYNNRNGLPTSEANAIAQTSDGFIWIGSYSGLIRYDGNTFERIDSTNGLANVRCLYVDSQDRLWVGTNDAGFFLMSEGDIRNWNMASGLDSVSIRVFTEEEDGLILIGSTSGIAMIDAGMQLTILKDERIAGETIRDLRRGADGLIYGLTENGDLFTIKNGKLQDFLSHDECRVKDILAMLPDPRHPGVLYLGTEDSQIYYGSMERNFASLGEKEIGELTYVEKFEYINGELWICCGNGIGKVDDLGFHRLVNVPMNASVANVMTDNEGNLWFASNRQGIMKVVPNQFSDLSERYDLPEMVVNSTCLYNKQLFIGTDTGLIVVEKGKMLDSLPLTQAVTASGNSLDAEDLLSLLDGVRIRSIIRDSQGRLWISTWRRYGLLRYDQGKVMAFNQGDGLFSSQIRAISECEDGTILVADAGGVNIIQEDQVTGGYGEKDGITNTATLTVTEGFHHEVILGSDGGGIFVIQGEETKHIGVEDGLSSEVVMRIKRSRDRELYWIVTSNSLAYMTADFRVTTIRQFPYSNNYDLFENSKGDVWVLSSNGIYVISRDLLLANETVEPVFYGIGSGLPYMATANSYSEQTQEGDLYIAGSSGITKVNIEKPFEDFSELKVNVPYIDADGKRYYPESPGSFKLPGNVRRLTIYPYVFNYSLIDPQVSYRLEGFDLEDTTVSRSKLKPLDYTNLGVGVFHFMMTVKDPVGRSEQNVSFEITKGREITVGTVGSIILILASLLLTGGIVVYTYPYRNMKRLDDRMLISMIVLNAMMAVGEFLSFILEYITTLFARELTIAGNTMFYICLVLFPYLYLIYLIYRVTRDKAETRKRKLQFGIPCFLFCALMILNLKTGWVFSIGEENNYIPGFLSEKCWLPLLLVMFYFLIILIKLYRVNARMAVLGVLLITGRFALELWCRDISSTSFIYTLILMCIHLYLMDQPVNEVAL